MLRKIWRVLAGSATLAAAVLFSTSVQAGIIRGAWDSDFGGSYQGTGFRGSVEFFVPDACLPTGLATAGYIADSAPCSAGDMSLIEASATLYDNTGTDLSTIVFAPPVQSPDPVLGVFVDWDGSRLLATELRSDLMGPQPSGVGPLLAPENLFLRFSWGGVDPDTGVGPGGETLDAGAYLIGCIVAGETCVPSDELRSTPATVTYAMVPEPDSLLLFLGALGAGWLVRHRGVAS